MASIFHQPVLSVHIMSDQNSVFIALIDQQTNPAKVKCTPVSETSSRCSSTELGSTYIFYITAGLFDN